MREWRVTIKFSDGSSVRLIVPHKDQSPPSVLRRALREHGIDDQYVIGFSANEYVDGWRVR